MHISHTFSENPTHLRDTSLFNRSPSFHLLFLEQITAWLVQKLPYYT